MSDFSPRTVLAAVEAFSFSTNAQIENLAWKYDLVDALGDGGIAKKESRLARHLVENPDLKGYAGSSLVYELIERVITERCKSSWGDPLDAAEVVPKLIRSFRQDGFEVRDGKLVRIVPDAVPVAAAQDELARLLQEHEFLTAIGHLDQAIAANARGDWAAANGQIRTFVEEFFDRIAEGLSGGETNALATSHARRQWLATCDPPFFDSALNEWELESVDIVKMACYPVTTLNRGGVKWPQALGELRMRKAADGPRN